jgi:hypothetical protein
MTFCIFFAFSWRRCGATQVLAAVFPALSFGMGRTAVSLSPAALMGWLLMPSHHFHSPCSMFCVRIACSSVRMFHPSSVASSSSVRGMLSMPGPSALIIWEMPLRESLFSH